MDKELNNGCYIKNFILSPSFQEKQPWVMWLTGKLSVIPAHYWTSSRFLGGFATVGLYSINRPYLSIIAFLLFALTDWIDGKVARSRNEHGGIGAVLDGVADKVFILPIIVWWCYQLYPYLLYLAVPLAIIEFISYPLILLAHIMGWIKKERKEIYEHIMAGKYKFFLQVISVFALWAALRSGSGEWPWVIGIGAILGGVIVLAALSIAGKINPKWAI